MTITFHSLATDEFLHAIRFYQEETWNLGSDFMEEVDKAVERVAEHPPIGSTVLGMSRGISLPRFPYELIYRIESAESIKVGAVAHQQRKPGYWLDRL